MCTRAVHDDMRTRRWGRIVNISSATVHVGYETGIAYVASKAGLIGLTRSLAREVGAEGITVNAITPGAVYTDRLRARDPEGVTRRRLPPSAGDTGASRFGRHRGSGCLPVLRRGAPRHRSGAQHRRRLGNAVDPRFSWDTWMTARNLRGKVAIVIGGAAGIGGRPRPAALADRGAAVVFCDVDAEAVAATSSELNGRKYRVWPRRRRARPRPAGRLLQRVRLGVRRPGHPRERRRRRPPATVRRQHP